ncbi:hypothetical protein, partial [Sinorhizobium meliloti]|uniref:hypothetical protein n=1 Tax=Rhizobium meliloti TaxID=382 RepID=UPI000FE0603F
RNQSHPQSPRSSKPGESDILTLQKQDTLTLRLQITYRTGNLMELGKSLVGSSPFDDLEKWQRLFATVILKPLFAQP